MSSFTVNDVKWDTRGLTLDEMLRSYFVAQTTDFNEELYVYVNELSNEYELFEQIRSHLYSICRNFKYRDQDLTAMGDLYSSIKQFIMDNNIQVYPGL